MGDGITDYQAKYFAYELTRRAGPGTIDRLASAVAGAEVDLNPHQVEAALFAYKSPLSKGALLADEVGLGKTIEAGLVLSQHWAERKRRLLVITPANLRKQWYQELTEKFYLPCQILEAKSYNEAVRRQNWRPFDTVDYITICSYQFARLKAGDVATVPWDLVVIDEAHRLRNVYKGNAKIAGTIKDILATRRKLLLTATPLQNSLMELYGLVSIIDEHVFGDVESFREQFMGGERATNYSALKKRLEPVSIRTLRRQVSAYVSYTKRLPMLEEFTPEESEDILYDMVSEYLRRPKLHALPSGQRQLMTLVLRKLLASSTFAIASALRNMSIRLRASIEPKPDLRPLDDELGDDYEALDETEEEWTEEMPVDVTPAERAEIEAEADELETMAALAESVGHNAKGAALLQALGVAMDKTAELGAERKAIIFTESRKTQDYLQRILADTEWKNGIVLFNGTNTDERSREILKRWQEEHKGTDRVTGSRTADMRSALVDYFREEGQIMIATEAAAEGINLQFCSLVVNYDLPWNPQRIEQRIGRCHRYGQKHDVVVVNFLNRKNEADKRVYELLAQKFQLFEGVFGASDEVLGALESGVDFERRIAEIYQNARRSEEIESAFTQLQMELSPQINAQVQKTRQQLLENLDQEVIERLRVQQEQSQKALSRHERTLWRLSEHELRDVAEFHDGSSFTLRQSPNGESIPTGGYELPRHSADAHIYRVGHPLAQHVIAEAKNRELLPAELVFQLTGRLPRISALEPFIGKRGQLAIVQLTIEALDTAEDHLILAAVSEDGEQLDQDLVWRMLRIPARVEGRLVLEPCEALDRLVHRRQVEITDEVSTRNLEYFQAETEKLDAWSDDQKVGLEREIKELDRQIREARKVSKAAFSLEEKLDAQKETRALESERNRKKRELFDAQDEIEARRDELILTLEGKLTQTTTIGELSRTRWALG